MAFLDYTASFIDLRSRMKSNSVYGGVLTDEDMGEKPKYVLLDEKLKKMHVKIERSLGDLEKKYGNKSVLVNDFGNGNESEIDALADSIANEFGTYQKTIKTLFPKEYKDSLEKQESLPLGETYASLQIRKGLEQTHTIALAGLMQRFRKMQIEHETHQKTTSGGAFNFNDGFESYTRGFTAEQDMAVAQDIKEINTRLDDIKQIARSVQQIGQIFEELHVMVCDQGTLLDRVDNNLAMAENETREAVKEIEKANEHQKAARFKMCILLLMLLIVGIVVGVIIFKTVLK